MTTEDLLHTVGDCGLFQAVFIAITHGVVLVSQWSFSFMAFGNYDPGWSCNDIPIEHDNNSNYLTNGSNSYENNSRNYGEERRNLQSCNVYDSCKNIVYNSDSSTIVTEWHLSCGNNWVTFLIISLQMGGSIIGNFIGGFFNNTFGRKKTHFVGVAVHIILNLIAAFSTSWQMFAVMRFLIGMSSANIDVTGNVYPMEMINNKWRAAISALPFSNFSGALFGVMAMIFHNWRIIHLATAVASLLFFLPVFWIPESIRWLIIRNKKDEACEAIGKIAWMNRKECPSKQDIIRNISAANSSKHHIDHSMLDLYRNGFLSRTIILTYSVVSAVVCFIIVKFGVRSLSGNFYLNLLLFSLIPTVTLPVLPFLSNTIGRKMSQLIIICLQFLCCVSLASFDALPIDDKTRKTMKMVVALLMMVFTDAQWSLAFLGNIELYPTTLRSLGFSHSSGVGKIFAIAAPFLIPQDSESIMVPYIILAVICGVNFVLNVFLPETKDKHLEDYVSVDE